MTVGTEFNGRPTPVMLRIVAALERCGKLDAHELAGEACTCHNSLSGGGNLKKMQEMGLIHVAAWRRNSPGAPTPLFCAGPGAPAKPPRAYKPAERTKRWRQKVGYRTPEWETRQALKQLVNLQATAKRGNP